jgi:mRNA interferase HigB
MTRQGADASARCWRYRELRAGGGHEKVRVFNSNTLLGFGKEHADANHAVRELNRTLRGATWSKMQDVTNSYPSATILNAERVVFKIKGNDYSAIVAFDFLRQAAFIKFIGTHAEYNRADAFNIDLYPRRGQS